MKDGEILGYENTISLIIIGDLSVGKTSLMKRFTENIFYEDTIATVGIELHRKVITIKNNNYQIKIWDTCGQEKLQALTSNYYRNADGVIIVFSLNRIETFKHLGNWMTILREKHRIDVPICIIGNKLDEVKNRQVSKQEIQNFSSSIGIKIFEVSAKNNTNVNESFNYIINKVLEIKNLQINQLYIVPVRVKNFSCC